MRFGQNVPRVTWKSVLYNFHEKNAVFQFSKEFAASLTILRTLTLKNAIWPKRAATDLKRAFSRIFIKRALFSFLKEFQASVTTLRTLTVKTAYLAKTCCAWPEKSVLYNFHGKRTDFPSWREFEPSFTILRTMTLKNVIWPKRAPHDLKIAFGTFFIESALFSCFEENLRPVSRFWELWRSKMRFRQNVLRVTWKERFVQFSWRPHCFSVLKRIWGQFHHFENFDIQKCDLAKTCSAWPEMTVLHDFDGKGTVFPFLQKV